MPRISRRRFRLALFRLTNMLLALVLLLPGCWWHRPQPPDVTKTPSERIDDILYGPSVKPVSITHIQAPVTPVPDPRTPRSTDGSQVTELTLLDAINLGLSNSPILRTVSGTGTGVTEVGTIYDPAITDTQIDQALFAFDYNWSASTFWDRKENPPNALSQGNFTLPRSVDLNSINTALSKKLYSGGVATVLFDSQYNLVGQPSPFPGAGTPQYLPTVEFNVVQPVLRGKGVAVNRAPIVIAQVNSEQAKWEFTQSVLAMVRSIATAYWDYYAMQVQRDTIQEVLPLSEEVVRVERERAAHGAGTSVELMQAESYNYQYRLMLLQTQQSAADKEQALRNVLGLPATDGTTLVLVDRPIECNIALDWEETLFTAMDQRPDIMDQRLAVRESELNLLVEENGLLPQANFVAAWRIHGIGATVPSAFDSLAGNNFNDWQLGATASYTLGNRGARSRVWQRELELSRARANLQETARQAAHQLATIVREVNYVQLELDAARNAVRTTTAWRESARSRYQMPPLGQTVEDAVYYYLTALRNWQQSAAAFAMLVGEYNSAFARLEEAKGTLLADHGIVMHGAQIYMPRRAPECTIFPCFTGPYEIGGLFPPCSTEPPVPAPPPIRGPQLTPVPQPGTMPNVPYFPETQPSPPPRSLRGGPLGEAEPDEFYMPVDWNPRAAQPPADMQQNTPLPAAPPGGGDTPSQPPATVDPLPLFDLRSQANALGSSQLNGE